MRRIDLREHPIHAGQQLLKHLRQLRREALAGEEAHAHQQIGERRERLEAEPLREDQVAALRAAAAAHGGQLHLCSDKARLDELAEILGIGDAIRMFSANLHAEMMSELRWTPKETETTRDGIDILTLELTGAQRSMIRMMRRFGVARFMRKIGAGKAFIAANRQTLAASSAFAVVTIPGHGLADYLQGGRAMERVWLTATSLGLSLIHISEPTRPY